MYLLPSIRSTTRSKNCLKILLIVLMCTNLCLTNTVTPPEFRIALADFCRTNLKCSYFGTRLSKSDSVPAHISYIPKIWKDNMKLINSASYFYFSNPSMFNVQMLILCSVPILELYWCSTSLFSFCVEKLTLFPSPNLYTNGPWPFHYFMAETGCLRVSSYV